MSVQSAVHPRVMWRGAGTYLDVDNRDEGADPLRTRPRWQAQSQFDFMISDDINLYTAASFVGDFFNSSIPTGLIYVDGRLIMDAGMSWNVGDNVEVLLSGSNLFSVDYQEAIGVQEPSTVFRFGLNFTI